MTVPEEDEGIATQSPEKPLTQEDKGKGVEQPESVRLSLVCVVSC